VQTSAQITADPATVVQDLVFEGESVEGGQ
jgi:hypothetical protein